MWRANKKRDREAAAEGVLSEEVEKAAIERGMHDMTELDNKGFRYSLRVCRSLTSVCRVEHSFSRTESCVHRIQCTKNAVLCLSRSFIGAALPGR